MPKKKHDHILKIDDVDYAVHVKVFNLVLKLQHEVEFWRERDRKIRELAAKPKIEIVSDLESKGLVK